MRSVPIGVLALVFLPGIVAAQQPGEASGAPRPFSLEASVTTGGEYTDNFFREESRAQSNFRQTVTPDIALELTGPFHRARLRYHPTGAYSTLLDELQHFQAAEASAAYNATPFFTVRATDEFSQSDSPGVIDPNTRQAKRITATRNIATLELPYLTETWSATPRGAWTATANESDTPQADERSRILTLGVDGVLTLVPFNTTLRAGGDATRARFRRSGDFSGQTFRGGASRPIGPRLELTLDGSLSLRQPDRSEDFHVRNAAFGGRYQLSETVLFSGRVGYQETDVTEQPGRQGLTYSTQASYTGAYFTLVTTSDLSIQETFSEVENVGVVRTQSFGATLTYQATEDLQVKGVGRWSSTTFLQQAAVQPKTEQKDTVIAWTLSASYQLTRTVKLNSALEHTRRDSTRPENSFSANTLRLELAVDFR